MKAKKNCWKEKKSLPTVENKWSRQWRLKITYLEKVLVNCRFLTSDMVEMMESTPALTLFKFASITLRRVSKELSTWYSDPSTERQTLEFQNTIRSFSLGLASVEFYHELLNFSSKYGFIPQVQRWRKTLRGKLYVEYFLKMAWFSKGGIQCQTAIASFVIEWCRI